MNHTAQMASGQLAFDIEDLIREAALDHAAPWAGAPLHFTTDYYRVEDIAAARARFTFEHGRNWEIRNYVWMPSPAVDPTHAGDHTLDLLSVDLRCRHYDHGCQCTGDLLYQAHCDSCGWHHTTTSENGAVESWHDHAFPGWRDLPVIPTGYTAAISQGTRGASTRAAEWVDEHYPTDWITPGAPIVTIRTPGGTRHVPGRSPLGGYDICIATTDQEPTITR